MKVRYIGLDSGCCLENCEIPMQPNMESNDMAGVWILVANTDFFMVYKENRKALVNSSKVSIIEF